MDEQTKRLVEDAEDRATLKPRPSMGGASMLGYHGTSHACEDVLALCEALRKTDAEREQEVDLRRQEREAWIEFFNAQSFGCDRGEDCPDRDFCLANEKRIDAAKAKLIASGISAKVLSRP